MKTNYLMAVAIGVLIGLFTGFIIVTVSDISRQTASIEKNEVSEAAKIDLERELAVEIKTEILRIAEDEKKYFFLTSYSSNSVLELSKNMQTELVENLKVGDEVYCWIVDDPNKDYTYKVLKLSDLKLVNSESEEIPKGLDAEFTGDEKKYTVVIDGHIMEKTEDNNNFYLKFEEDNNIYVLSKTSDELNKMSILQPGDYIYVLVVHIKDAPSNFYKIRRFG